MLRAFGLGTILVVFWLLLSGHYTLMLISFGVGSSALVVYLALRMDVVDHEGVPLQLGGRFWLYLPWLMKEIFVANVAVAKVILHPKLPISPITVIFHGSQKTDIGRFIYANSITLTPGTITTGVEGQDFEIHALTYADVDGREEDEMDRRVTWVEQGD
ncbi:MAG: Na+/H+ antiporter subunit E [Gemmatimonadetes bacterium]|nr:Na+/H+ antiporter subunit E [Gemmatimonadota bacterium]MEE2846177.1 Na+/H+ antiporter subunit E [Gemmatimonadota bacterium]HAC05227.1 cation transporter [Gemmatimonadota bacterium]HBD96740.1 cation transporter [Gemmatimonadota bacterium]HIC53722.1 cation transporter [Gemmatimonadota bacterium]